jgi:molybdopterin-guanine dinucleotide biosynthesis protein A
LAAAHNEHLLVLPCDVPNIDARLLTDLRKTAQRNPRLPVMVRHGEFWEPLICIIPTYLRTEVEHAWHAGERSPRKILLQLGSVGLECPADDPRLANLNTPALLQPRSDVSE